ncbi:MAG: hypothetical protein LBR70_06680 [Lactobacillaceae bacterium]|nr:hypothetical protein [Lactobacillaceae bacterium]
MPTIENIKNLLEDSFSQFLNTGNYLIEHNLHEQTISTELVLHCIQVYDRDIPNNKEDNYDKYLDFLNYDDLRNPMEYREKNKEFVTKSVLSKDKKK